MPGIVSHWLLGQRILKNEDVLQRFPDLNREAFLWGCQGPDALFLHRVMPWQTGSLRKYGGILHNGDPTALLLSLAKICRYDRMRSNGRTGADSDIIFAYALGFCCHYCFDRRVHPLVYYNCMLLEKTDERGSDYNYHADIENSLDIMLLRHDTGRLLPEMRLTDCLPPCEEIDSSLAVLYSLLLCDVCGVHTPRESAMTIASDFRSHTALLDDPHALKRSAAETAEAVQSLLPPALRRFRRGTLTGKFHPRTADMSFDYGNLLGSVWFHPDDRSERSNMDFYELTDLAETESLELISLFADEVAHKGSANFALFTRGLNFSGKRMKCEV